MYTLVKGFVLRLVKAPNQAPEAPAGSHDSVRAFRAHPNFLSYSLLSLVLASAVSYLLPALLMVIATAKGEAPPFLIGLFMVPALACIQFFVYFAVRIDYDMRYYIVTDRSLRVREGALVVKEKTITYANVQNLRVVQGPLLRLFGIWHLEVDTAGGGGGGEQGKHQANRHSVKIAGIDNAHAIRDLILGHLRARGADAGLGDLDDRDAGRGPGMALDPELLPALRELRAATAALRTTAEEKRS